jgi:hypothetical protein
MQQHKLRVINARLTDERSDLPLKKGQENPACIGLDP